MESEFAIEKVQEKIQECLNTGETAAAQYEGRYNAIAVVNFTN